MPAQLLLRLTLWWLLLLAPWAAHAIDLQLLSLPAAGGRVPLVGHAQTWVEPGHSRTVEEVAAAGPALDWEPLAEGQQFRIDGRALWVRLRVEAAELDRWYLTVDSSGIDRVQLFHRDAAGRWAVDEAGDTRPVSQWPVPGRVPTFELPRGSGPVDLWLRIEHERVDYAARLALVSQGELLASREREQLFLGGYFGVAAMLALVAVLSALAWRDRNFAAYSAYLVTFTLGQAAYIGVGAQHLWDSWLEWNSQSTFVLPGLSAAAALWFVLVVTEPARFSRVLHRAVWVLVALLLAALVYDTVAPSRASLALRLGLTSLVLPLVAVLIWLVWRTGDDPDIKIVAMGFVPVMVMAIFPIARGFNLIPNSVFTRYGLAIGAAMEMPILFYALVQRAARRREAQQRALALPRTDALTGVADRRSLLQRLDAALARARGQKHPCALLLVKLANFDHVANEYGREILERALVVTASHLRRTAADIDLVARVGEREFALLLEGPTNPDVATARAQQLVASGLRPSQVLPRELTLRLQVVMAMLPDQPPDAPASLEWLEAAMAAIRPESRKQIRSLNF